MSDQETRPLDHIEAPFNKQIELFEGVHDNGVRLLRLRIREGNRFTTMELDPDTARRWGAVMTDWSAS